MTPLENKLLTPRETVLRMLEHLRDNASYAEIIRQVRILQDIEKTLKEVEPKFVGDSLHDRDATPVGAHPASSFADAPPRGAYQRARHASAHGRRRLPDLLLREAAWLD